MLAKFDRFGFLAASIIAVATAGPALAQSSEVSFSQGANNGAKDIADQYYGASTPKTTAIVDLDNDGSAEIGVQFTDDCQDNSCRFGFLYYSGGEWLEVVSDRAERVWLGEPVTGELRPIRTSDDTEWNWFNSRYLPGPTGGEPLYDVGEPINVLTDREASLPSVRELTDPTGYRYDLDGDGAQETFLFPTGNEDCFQQVYCPAVIVGGDGAGVIETTTTDGRFTIKDGDAFVLRSDGFSKLAKNGQTFREVYSKRASEVRR